MKFHNFRVLAVAGFGLLTVPAPAQTIPAGGEYYLDADPGPGNGTPVPAPAAPGVPESFTVPPARVAALSTGVHSVSVRYRDAAGQWGAPATAWFHHEAESGGGNAPAGGEYFVDADPGPGNGTAIPAPAAEGVPGELIMPAALIANVPTGVHSLSVRYRDGAGRWGAPATAWFHKEEPDPAAETLAAVEWDWWLGEDSSNRRTGAPVIVAPGKQAEALLTLAPGAALTAGTVVSVRAWWRGASGRPGIPSVFRHTLQSHGAAFGSAFFTPAELQNPDVSGDLKDADGDGVPNLLEMALGTDPRQPSGGNSGTVSGAGGQEAVILDFPRLPGGTTAASGEYTAGGLAYQLEELGADGTWRDLVPQEAPLTSQGVSPVSGFETVRVALPVRPGQPRRLVRLRVSR